MTNLDAHVVKFQCPSCGHDLEQSIGRLKSSKHMQCPGVARYRQPNHRRSIVEIVITIGPFVLLWLLAWFSLRFGYGVYLLLAIPAAGFLVRLFMIQHDCGHGSFFRHRLVNDWVGRVIGVLTLTPYDFWRRAIACRLVWRGKD
jgi:omega-6 fatty acid desaturase (delta-12 desaturase)